MYVCIHVCVHAIHSLELVYIHTSLYITRLSKLCNSVYVYVYVYFYIRVCDEKRDNRLHYYIALSSATVR